MKAFLLGALLCAPALCSHAADVAGVNAPVVAPQTDATRLAWKVALSLNDVEAARKLVAAPDFSPALRLDGLRLDGWNRSVLGAALAFERGTIARVIIEAAPRLALADSTQLVRLGKSENWPALQALLATREFDPNRKYGNGESPHDPEDEARFPLLEAVKEGNLEGVRALLAHPKTNVTIRDGAGDTALHLVAYGWNRREVAALLLRDPRFDPNAINNKSETPLHLAARDNNSTEFLETLLLDSRAKLDLKNRAGQTPLDVAALSAPDKVNLLLATGQLRPTAEQQRAIAKINGLLLLPAPTAQQLRWVHILATNDVGAARAQASKPGFDPLLALSNGDSLLASALGSERPAVALALLDNAKNRDYLKQEKLLYFLVQTANLPVLKRFLAQPSFEPVARKFAAQLLREAVGAGNLEGVRALLASPGLDPNATDILGQGALSATSVNSPHAPAIAALLLADPRVEPNITDTYGNSALLQIAYFGSPATLQVFLADPRVDVNRANKRGETPLYMAAGRNHLGWVKLLLDSRRAQIGAQERAAINKIKADWGISEANLFGETK